MKNRHLYSCLHQKSGHLYAKFFTMKTTVCVCTNARLFSKVPMSEALIILYSSFRTLSNIVYTSGLHCTAMAKSKVTTIPVHCYTILVSMRVSLFRLTQCSRVGTLMEEITGQRAQESHFHIRCSISAIESVAHRRRISFKQLSTE